MSTTTLNRPHLRASLRNRPRIRCARHGSLEREVAAYNAEEDEAEAALARHLASIAAPDDLPEPPARARTGGRACAPEEDPLDDSFGRLSAAELHSWMLSRGFEAVPPEQSVTAGNGHGDVAAAGGGGAGGAGGLVGPGAGVRIQGVMFRMKQRHEDQDIDWEPFMPANFTSAAARSFWLRMEVMCV